MDVFEIVIFLLLIGAALASLARRMGAPYPALIALSGAGLALLPGLPAIQLDPELALALFVAPVLVDAAFDSSLRDLRVNWRSVASLALGAVALTIGLVALVVHALVPSLPWPAALALGAIVAPPDAASATTVLKQLRPPHRLLVILEGESLFNDASALLAYRLAVGATLTGAIAGWKILPMLLFVTLGSTLLGIVLSRITLWVNTLIEDMSTIVVFQFCCTFFVWTLAERLHLSGIITLVVYAMSASRIAPAVIPARLRVPSWAVWEVAVFVLNVLAFVLVGFQLKQIMGRAETGAGFHYLFVIGMVSLTVILARLIWVMGATLFSHWQCKDHPLVMDYKSALVVGWCGMRGTVTLAAALALPIDFPYRDLILATAFGVTIGTLVLQGLTLKPLIAFLKLEDDGSVEREIRHARAHSLNAAVNAIESSPCTETAGLVRQSYQLQQRRAELELKDRALDGVRLPDELLTEAHLIRRAAEAQRQALLDLRGKGTIGDAAFQQIQEELDWMELGWAQILRS